jgi:hypothetical protein
MGARATTGSGPATTRPGAGRCRGGGDPPRGGWAQGRLPRSRLLPALVEIMFAAGDAHAARAAADELSAMADDLDAPLLRALATHAQGAVLLLVGDARAALGALRHAWAVWQELEVPYEAARVRVLSGLACRQLGDEETARMELDAARWSSQSSAPRLTSRERRRYPTRQTPGRRVG